MRKEKSLLLNAMTDVIEKSESMVLTSYNKMSANVAANFRGVIHDAGGEFTVVKKNMLLKAAEKLGFNLDFNLDGHIGVINVNERFIETAKALYKFSAEHEKVITVIGGQFEGKACTSKEIEMISKLPSQNEMRAQLLAVLEAPMSHTLSCIEEFLKTVSYVMDEKEQQE